MEFFTMTIVSLYYNSIREKVKLVLWRIHINLTEQTLYRSILWQSRQHIVDFLFPGSGWSYDQCVVDVLKVNKGNREESIERVMVGGGRGGGCRTRVSKQAAVVVAGKTMRGAQTWCINHRTRLLIRGRERVETSLCGVAVRTTLTIVGY